MTACPFCDRIKAGEYETWPGVTDPGVVWFEPLNPVTPGHLLFVPVRHVPDALADPYLSGVVMEDASRWALQHPGGGADGWNLTTSAGAAASQAVYHYHLHLVPRRAGDGLLLPWTLQRHGGIASLRKALAFAIEGKRPEHGGDHAEDLADVDAWTALLESLGGEG